VTHTAVSFTIVQKGPNRQVQMPIQKNFTLHSNPEFGIIDRKVPLRFAPTGSEVVFTSNWKVQNSSQLVNNVVLDVIEALDTTPKCTDKF